MSISRLAVISLLLLAIIPAHAQQSPTRRNYAPGQVWSTALGPTITILAIENRGSHDKIVHIRIDKIPADACGGLHLMTSIDHVAVSEKMLGKNAVDLVQQNAEIPDASLEPYRKWNSQKKHKISEQPLPELIRSAQVSYPAMCGTFPDRTL
jgi:hypothetical protein